MTNTKGFFNSLAGKLAAKFKKSRCAFCSKILPEEGLSNRLFKENLVRKMKDSLGEPQRPPHAIQEGAPQWLVCTSCFDKFVNTQQICGACRRPVPPTEGYVLPAKKVVTKNYFWRMYFSNPLPYVPATTYQGGAITNFDAIYRYVVGQQASWLICETCYKTLGSPFDSARADAKKWWGAGRKSDHVKEAGPVPVEDAVEPATKGFYLVYRKPSVGLWINASSKPNEALPQEEFNEICPLIEDLATKSLGTVLGSDPYFSLRRLGKRVVPYLTKVIDYPNYEIAEKAVKLLGEVGGKEAIPVLQKVVEDCNIWEVRKAALTGLAQIKKIDDETLPLDTECPYQQISEVWTAVIQGRKQLYTPNTIYEYGTRTMERMPKLMIESEKMRSRMWAMLAELIYIGLNASWDRDIRTIKHCPQAGKCMEEALRCDPQGENVEMWNQFLKAYTITCGDSP